MKSVIIDTNIVISGLEALSGIGTPSKLQKDCAEILRLGQKGMFSLLMISDLKEQYEAIDKHRLEKGKPYNTFEMSEISKWMLSGRFGRRSVELPVTTNLKDGLFFHTHMLQADYLVTEDRKVLNKNKRMQIQRIALKPHEFLKEERQYKIPDKEGD